MIPTAAASPEATRRQSARLSVAYVYRRFSRSGSIASLYARTAELLSQDVDLTSVCSTRGRAQTDAPIRFLDVEPALSGSGRITFAIECSSFARRATRAILGHPGPFDVVHSEGFACLWADVVSVHAVRRAEVKHYFDHVEPGARLRRHLSPRVFRPQVQVVLGIERKLFRSPAPLVICPSARVKDDLASCHGVPGELVEVVPYGVDVAGFRPDPGVRRRVRERMGAGDDTTVVLAVADDFERKGIARLIEALGRATTRAELWVIGGDDSRHYVRLAESAGVADRVHYVGRQPPRTFRVGTPDPTSWPSSAGRTAGPFSSSKGWRRVAPC